MEPDEIHDSSAGASRRPEFGEVPRIDEWFVRQAVRPETMDALWANAWRHFGPLFVRYSTSLENERLQRVQPLRVELEHFQLSRSQRRILRRNAALEVQVQPPRLDRPRRALFEIHKRRFRRNVPEKLENFLGPKPGVIPCEMVEVAVSDRGRLVAASYLDIGRLGASSLYAMFEPAYARRSLGIGTMLWEIEYARHRGCRYYYPGYAFHEPSALDYKKQFTATQWFDWRGHWRPLED